MTYDFDLLPIVPNDIQARYCQLFDQIGMADMAAQKVGVFRDPSVAKALSGASEDIRDCFEECGFNLQAYSRPAPLSRDSVRGEQERSKMVERLAQKLTALPDTADWNGFDVQLFLGKTESEGLEQSAQSAFKSVRIAEAAEFISSRVNSRPLSRPSHGF